MIKFIRTGIIALAALLLAWALPWCYTLIFARPSSSPFTLYSCIVHDFASIDYDEEGNFTGYDFAGNHYTENQFDSILPMFYYRQLASEGRFPSEIEGIPVTMDDAERTRLIFRSDPSSVNSRRPGVWQLLESHPSRVDFSSPEDVFRINATGIQFIGKENNKVNAEKSLLFTEALSSAGFVFPASLTAGNGSTRKEYDNGYLIADAEGSLFQLKQVDGQPYVGKVELPDGVKLNWLYVTEFPDRSLLGLLCGEGERLFALGSDYSVNEIPVGGFDPFRQGIMIIGDMFYWTVSVQDLDYERLVAVNPRNWTQVDSYDPPSEEQGWVKTAGWIFPFTLSFLSPLDSYVQPRFDDLSFRALWLGLALALVYMVLRFFMFRRDFIPSVICLESVLILIFGLYLFIPLLLFCLVDKEL